MSNKNNKDLIWINHVMDAVALVCTNLLFRLRGSVEYIRAYLICTLAFHFYLSDDFLAAYLT